MELRAHQRLKRIAQMVRPGQGAEQLTVQACASPSLMEQEGQAAARLAALKVCFLQGPGDKGVPLASRSEIEANFKKKGLDCVWAEDASKVPEDTIVMVTAGALVDAAVLSKSPKLQLVAVALTGYDNIDLDVCQARGIIVSNVPGYSADATAELAVGLILSQLRRLPALHKAVAVGQWNCPLQEDLRTKTIGIIGTGQIGLRLAEIMKAFKVKKTIGYSLAQSDKFVALGGEYVGQLSALFLEADIICVCVPLTTFSKGLVSESLMNLLQPESLLINVSRGGVVDEAALAKFLSKGSFRAALDVFNIEPLPADDPLKSVPEGNLIMTPHVGYQSQASLAERYDVTVKNILAFLAGQPVNTVTKS